MKTYIIEYKLVDSDYNYDMVITGRWEEVKLVYDSMVYLTSCYREVNLITAPTTVK